MSGSTSAAGAAPGQPVVPGPPAATQSVDLDIQGMTCASCAAGSRRSSTRSTESPPPSTTPPSAPPSRRPPESPRSDIMEVVAQAGYGATLPVPEAEKADEAAALKPRVLWSFALSIAVVVVSMVPALQFPPGSGSALVLSSVVVLWLGRNFHPARLDQRPARHHHHGHARVHGHAHRLRLVAVRDGLRPRRHDRDEARVLPDPQPAGRARLHLLRGRRHHHLLPPARPLHRGPRQDRVRRRPARAPRGGRQAGQRPRDGEERRVDATGRCAWATSSWCAPARRSRPTARWWRVAPPSTPPS